MRKFILATAAVAAFATGALAAPTPSQTIRAAVDDLAVTQEAAFVFGGHRHCWYARGWNGPGWYWCGYSHRKDRGWGGNEGWNGWRHR